MILLDVVIVKVLNKGGNDEGGRHVIGVGDFKADIDDFSGIIRCDILSFVFEVVFLRLS